MPIAVRDAGTKCRHQHWGSGSWPLEEAVPWQQPRGVWHLPSCQQQALQFLSPMGDVQKPSTPVSVFEVRGWGS